MYSYSTFCLFSINVCEKMEWPGRGANLNFGLTLANNLNEVFDGYVRAFYDVIMADDNFDKHELVIVLNSISEAANYLDVS